ncbi:hypothetical protein KKHLCK_09290 [Candidatus Electrothrix laxa]
MENPLKHKIMYCLQQYFTQNNESKKKSRKTCKNNVVDHDSYSQKASLWYLKRFLSALINKISCFYFYCIFFVLANFLERQKMNG